MSEYLAQFALSHIGFVVPVPRQEDKFGVDFIVHLATVLDNNVVPSGGCFALQVKSSAGPVKIDTPEKAQCLNDFPLPFFLGVVDEAKLNLAIYSTLPRFYFMWKHGRNIPFTLVPDDLPPEGKLLDWDKARVPLGPPACCLRIGELDDPDRKNDVRERFLEKMRPWLDAEQEALAWREHSVPLLKFLRGRDTEDAPVFDGWFLAANPLGLARIASTTATMLQSPRYYINDALKQGAPNSGQPGLVFPADLLAELREQEKRIDCCVDGFMRLANRMQVVWRQGPCGRPDAPPRPKQTE